MNGIIILLGSALIFLVAYVTYGSWLAKQWGIDPSNVTPANRLRDNVDYMPAKPIVLLGHHFSSIAGAGPIVGPITASVFGWLPVCLWIILGSVFVGGVHDFGCLTASVRHDGHSIGQVVESNVGRTAKMLFSVFSWVTLTFVVAAFANIVVGTFVSNPGVGTASLLFILLAVCFGYAVYRSGMSLLWGTIIGIVGVAASFWLGHLFPLVLSKDVWLIVLVIYIFIASVCPVWILLQPRDYLNSFLLYAMLIAAFFGILFYGPHMEIESYVGFDLGNYNYLFPMLFVTVACGAVSGFHSMVASGTTSKQLDSEKNTKLIGYGSMLIEGLLAICAIISVAYVAADQLPALLKGGGPANAFAHGIATFMTAVGFNFDLSKEFVALTVSAFAMTTLDTGTRLARFVLQELLGPAPGHEPTPTQNVLCNRYVATAITVACCWYLASGSYTTIWPMFGSANQMLAALSLLAVATWLRKEGRSTTMIMIPMFFMYVVTFCALIQVMLVNYMKNWILFVSAIVLLCLAVGLGIEMYRTFSKPVQPAQAPSQQQE